MFKIFIFFKKAFGIWTETKRAFHVEGAIANNSIFRIWRNHSVIDGIVVVIAITGLCAEGNNSPKCGYALWILKMKQHTGQWHH